MITIVKLGRDRRGTAALEFAFAAPVLLTMVIGVAQLGVMYSANNGVHHAVEEGARLAAVFPTPSDAEIEARVLATKFMTGTTAIDPVIARGTTADGDSYVDISLSYAVPLDFIFFEIDPVTVQHSRRVFRQVDLAGTGTGGGTGGGTGTGGGGTGGGGTDGGTGGGTGGKDKKNDDLPKGNGKGGK